MKILSFLAATLGVLVLAGAGCQQSASVSVNTNAGAQPDATATAETSVDKDMMIGVMMKMGKPMLIFKGGETKLLDREVKIDGLTVLMDGTILKKDGSSVKMEEGKTMMIGENLVGAGDVKVETKVNVGAAATATIRKGSYEKYDQSKLAYAKDGKVVIFFRAGWCPTCQGIDSDIKAHLGDIPNNVTILDLDYDNSTVLKQKYGVTYQHTFVQVDANGNLIKKWSGSPTLESLLAQVQ